jgi:hypothetical protein
VLLREDLRYIEAVARNELGLVKKGDLLYRHMESPAKKEEAVPAPDDSRQDDPRQNADPNPASQPGSSI